MGRENGTAAAGYTTDFVFLRHGLRPREIEKTIQDTEFHRLDRLHLLQAEIVDLERLCEGNRHDAGRLGRFPVLFPPAKRTRTRVDITGRRVRTAVLYRP